MSINAKQGVLRLDPGMELLDSEYCSTIGHELIPPRSVVYTEAAFPKANKSEAAVATINYEEKVILSISSSA